MSQRQVVVYLEPIAPNLLLDADDVKVTQRGDLILYRHNALGTEWVSAAFAPGHWFRCTPMLSEPTP